MSGHPHPLSRLATMPSRLLIPWLRTTEHSSSKGYWIYIFTHLDLRTVYSPVLTLLPMFHRTQLRSLRLLLRQTWLRNLLTFRSSRLVGATASPSLTSSSAVSATTTSSGSSTTSTGSNTITSSSNSASSTSSSSSTSGSSKSSTNP